MCESVTQYPLLGKQHGSGHEHQRDDQATEQAVIEPPERDDADLGEVSVNGSVTAMSLSV